MKKYYLRFKFLILILLMPLLGCYVFNENARAFYGICDRYIMCMVSINVLTCILYMTNPCILKIFLSIIKPEKKLDNALISWYSNTVEKTSKYIVGKRYLKWIGAWLLPSFILTPYLYWLSSVFFWPIMPLSTILYTVFAFKVVFHFSKSVTYENQVTNTIFCLNQAFSIILGGILYAFVYDTTLLHKCFYWTNPECGSYSLNFVPQLDVFRFETNAFMVYATCFSLPYIVKILIKRIKILISKNYGTLTVSENEN